MAKIELTAYMIRGNSAFLLLSANQSLTHQKEIPWTHINYITPKQPMGCIALNMEESSAEFFGLYTKPAMSALTPAPAQPQRKPPEESFEDVIARLAKQSVETDLVPSRPTGSAGPAPLTRSTVSPREAALATRKRAEEAPLVLGTAENDDEDHETDYRFNPAVTGPEAGE